MILLVFADTQVVLLPIISLIIGIIGLGGLLFTALRFRRDDTTAVVQQQSTIMDDMKTINEELRTQSSSLRKERDSLRAQVQNLTGQVQSLRTELHEAHAQLSGKMSRIEKKIDGNT